MELQSALHETGEADNATVLAALHWLTTAGVDVVVGDVTRNWLATPAAAPAPLPIVAAPVVAPTAPVATAAEGLAAAADSLAALDAAIAEFAHPLRQPAPPSLVSGNAASGIYVLLDRPGDDPAVAALCGRMLAAIGLDETNAALAWRLPWPTLGGHDPRDDQIAAFAPFLARAFTLAPPRLVLALGQCAALIAGRDAASARGRGRLTAFGSARLMPSFHPRRLLADPSLKRHAWADLQAFAAAIDG